MQKVRSKVYNFILMLIMGVFIFSTVLAMPHTAQAATSSTTTKIIAQGTKYATELYVIKSGVPGPVVMIVGGIHGNETAGYKAADKVKDYSIEKGTLLVLPQANKRAVAAHTRSMGGADLNRDFPTSKSDKPDNTMSTAIFNVVKEYNVDWLMDMHEGANYEKIKSSSSVGQSLIYYPDTQTKTIATKIVKSLNVGIKTSYKDFTLLRYPVSGSLASASAKVLGVNSFIFETCSKDYLSTRISYQLKAANMLLNYLQMK
ncbi:MAG: succinylglutamate desuccinylase/aspartoacylase family protein [Syntrophomonas sp.]|nr:succinylglutamate desuccinylase/aspartoacylase family protein [Syntrophomonas sp.]